MQFADIIGLAEIKQRLLKAVSNNHLAHALLFAGPEGGGQLSLALAMATYVNCTNKQEGDACGECPSCQKMKNIAHPDVHFAFPVSATKQFTGKDVVSDNFLPDFRKYLASEAHPTLAGWVAAFSGENRQVNISKEESRRIIRSLALKSYEAEYKVMIIWLPEKMHIAASNALLKIIEEPPKNTLFFLVTNQEQQLIGTIRSRTQMVKVPHYSPAELQEILQRDGGASEERAMQLAQIAETVPEAMALLEEGEEDSQELFRQWMRLCYSWDFAQLMQLTEAFAKYNKLRQQGMLQYGMSIMRASLLQHYGAQDLQALNQGGQDFVGRFSRVMNMEQVEWINRLIGDAAYHLERNANAKITFFNLSLRIASILRGQ
ncbi:DNA polymerase III subunit delta' [Persicobacter diffluens]|uniref:DNA polymerase III subunit delta n=1 Tax=Persicobacter diffluens TaxID=981 RepID=A0AAN4VUZ5_9BACT|nr:DNA polymerase III subunit delta [Persicobacter diffluens]